MSDGGKTRFALGGARPGAGWALRRIGLTSEAGVALRRMALASPILFAMSFGCGPLPGPGTNPQASPPHVAARVHTDFWSAVSALDFDGAKRLAASASQQQYLVALVDVAEERLVDAQMKLAALALEEQNKTVDAAFYRGIAKKLAEARGRETKAGRA